MRILQVAGSGSVGTRQMGPVSNDIFQLSREFAALGHKVCIYDAGSDASRERLPDGVTIVETDTLPRGKIREQVKVSGNIFGRIIRQVKLARINWRNESQFVRNMIDDVDLSEYDIIHFHEWKPLLIFQRLTSFPHVYTSHTPLWVSSNTLFHRGVVGLRRRLHKSFLRLLGAHEIDAIKRTTLTIALGDHVQRDVQSNNIVVIQNGVDIADWEVASNIEDARSRLGIDLSAYVVICVGRITKIKGVEILLRAADQLRGEIPEMYTVVIGSTSGSFSARENDNQYAVNLVRTYDGPAVRFTGFVDNRSDEFRDYLTSADLLVLPSWFDNQANVILEAFAMNLPVVATRVGGIPNMVPDTVGRLFEPGEVDALSAELKHLYRHPEKRRKLAGCTRQHVEANHTWEASARQHIAVFSRLVGEKKDV